MFLYFFTFSRRCFFYILRMFLSFFVVFPFFQIAEHPKFVPFAPSTDFSDRPAPTPPGGVFFPAEALQTPQGKLQRTTALRIPSGRMHLVAGLCVLKSLSHMVYILPCTEKVLSSVHSKKYQVLAVIWYVAKTVIWCHMQPPIWNLLPLKWPYSRIMRQTQITLVIGFLLCSCLCFQDILLFLEVKLPTIWTDEKQSRAEADRRERLEERRSEKRKSQKKEDADARKGKKVAKHYVFPMICGSGGSKSRLAKAAGAEPAGQMRDEKLHAVVARSTFWSLNVQTHTILGPLLEVEMSKKCTPLWREAHFEVKMYKTPQRRTTFGSWDVEKVYAVVHEAHFEVKMYKTHQLRTTFGSWDVEKVHAVVARSTFWSQNVQTHTILGPLLEVEMSKKCTPLWREAHFEVKMYKTPQRRTTFGGSDFASLHYTTLHYTTLHSTTLHYSTLHDTTLQLQLHNYTPLHPTTLHYTKLHYTTLHYATLHSTTLHYTTLHFTTLHYSTLHDTTLQLHNYTPLHSTTLHYTKLHYTTLHYTTLHSTTLHYITLHCATFHYTSLHYTTLHYTTTTTTTTQLHSTTRNYITLHYATLHYTEWHCTTDRQVDR